MKAELWPTPVVPSLNAPSSTVPVTVTTASILAALLAVVTSPESILLRLTVVVPVTFPVIARLSDPDDAEEKFASRVTVPPPEKLPDTVSSSLVSASSPTSSVPPEATVSVPAVRECVPVPKLTVDPDWTLTVSQPVTFAPFSAPVTSLSSRVLLVPPPPVSVPMAPMSVLSNVSFSESSANFMSPLSVAPLSTTMLSQPFRPSETTVA